MTAQRSTRTYTPPLTPDGSAALSAVLAGEERTMQFPALLYSPDDMPDDMPQQTVAVKQPTQQRPADPCPGAVLILGRVPADKRGIVRAYLNSRQPADVAQGKALAALYGIDYAAVRRRWGVEVEL